MLATIEQSAAIGSPRESAVTRGAALLCSLCLHAAIALLIILGLPGLLKAPAETPMVVPVDLVQFGDKTEAPAAEQKAQVPQEQASETATVDAPEAVPVPQSPPPAPAPDVPTSREGAKPEPRTATHPPKPPAPVDELAARLQALARLHQPAAHAPPAPRQQDGTGTSNVTASTDAARGPQASYSVKDFLRAQIERHWTMEQAVAHIPNAVVLIHLGVSRDGKVTFAEVVPDPRYRTDDALRELAYSARNAVLMSSPLTLPPGRYEEVRDITLDFRPRDVLR